MARRDEVDALVGILMDPANVDKSAEELAGELITSLDRVRAERDRIAVFLRYTLDQGVTQHYGVLGPYPDDATEQARRDGQGIAGRTTRPGRGQFLIVPMYRDARQAWDAVDPPRINHPVAPRPVDYDEQAGRRPVCRCGLRPSGPRDSGVCPRHPERKR